MVIIITSLTGCNCDFKNGVEMAVIIAGGCHANSVNFNVNEIKFSDDTNNENDNVTPFFPCNCKIIDIYGVVIDGHVTKSISNETEDLYNSIETVIKNKRWDTAQTRLNDLNTVLSSTVADDPEVNTMDAFFVAMEHFKTIDKTVEKRLVIYDTGLSTQGFVDFAHNQEHNALLNQNRILTTEEIETMVNKLDEEKNIPDLKNVRIQWYGLGLVGGKQQPLSNLAKENLKNIWKAILNRSGALVSFKSIDYNEDINSDKTLPEVSLVHLKTNGDSTTYMPPQKLNVSKLGFKPMTAEFIEGTEKEREKILSDFVPLGQSEKILLVGTTSSGGGNGDGLDLSYKRVVAVKTILIKMGVPQENIESMGLGTKHHMYNKNEYINGKYIGTSDAAKENRSVYIIPFNSTEADLFLSDYYQIFNENFEPKG